MTGRTMNLNQRFVAATFAASLVLAGAPAEAQFRPPPLQPLYMTSAPGPRTYQAERVGVFNGKTVPYRAELTETMVKDKDGGPITGIFALSYVAKAPGAERRPVVFIYNGGPGGASVFLNFGALGPKIFEPDLDGKASAPSTKLVDNPLAFLDVADLVFLDPPDTGYSRTPAGVDTRRLYSIDGDSEAMSQAVVNWLRTHDRLNAPVYLYGESYGSMRAVAMARDLLRAPQKIDVAGVMFGGNSFGYFQKGQMPDILYQANALPMMASVAWFHGKVDNRRQTWEQAVDKARRYAHTDYISALMLGNRAPPATRRAVMKALPGIIGIDENYFRSRDTMVIEGDFFSQLLKDRGLVVDGGDGRKTHPASDRGETASPFARYGSAMETLARDTLGANELGPYVPFNPKLNPSWNYYVAGAMALDVTLAEVMRDKPDLRVLMTQGRYDTLTTLGNSEYLMAQTRLPLGRYSEAYYDGGHSLLPQPEVMSAMRTFLKR